MNQTLVIQEKFFYSLQEVKNLKILKEKGCSSASDFLNKIIKKLNDEFNFLEIVDYRFQSKAEMNKYSQYSAFVEGDNLPFEKVVVFFTPIDSKMGNVIIEQSLMPTICNQMEDSLTFLLDNTRYKKIVVLISKINLKNEAPVNYNKLQMDINSLNTLNFDVIPFFNIKNLSTDTKFNSLTEYLDMSDYLQRINIANSQYKFLRLENSTLFGDCEKTDLKGEFHKSFCFRFLTAIFSGGNDYNYNIDDVLDKLPKLDNQFANLKKFVDYANGKALFQIHTAIIPVEDTIDSDDDLENIDDIHRKPERGIDSAGRKRFKTQKKIRDSVLEKANYICNCNDSKHFYFESIDLHNYVEGHHVVPMNRQEEYYFDDNINLDIPNNIVPLCPNCHCQIHLGSRQARIKIISELYIRNKARLLSFKPNLTLSLLASYYNIGLESEEERDWLRRAEKIVEDKKRSV